MRSFRTRAVKPATPDSAATADTAARRDARAAYTPAAALVETSVAAPVLAA